MKIMLIVAAAGLTFSGSLCAQGVFDDRGVFEGQQLGQAAPPAGRAHDTSLDSPERVDFGIDFSAAAAPPHAGNSAQARQGAPLAGSADRTIDAPLEAAVRNGYDSSLH